MRNTLKRMLTLALAIVLVCGLIPVQQAAAATEELSGMTATSSYDYKRLTSVGHKEYQEYVPMVDGVPLICADPAVAGAEPSDVGNYTVTKYIGWSEIWGAGKDALLGSGNIAQIEGNKEQVVTDIIEMMTAEQSLVRQGKMDAQQGFEALQSWCWEKIPLYNAYGKWSNREDDSILNPNLSSETIRALQSQMEAERNRLFNTELGIGNLTVTSNDGGASTVTKSQFETSFNSRGIYLEANEDKTESSREFTISGDMSKVHYIKIIQGGNENDPNATAIFTFEVGETHTSRDGNFLITRTANGVTTKILNPTDPVVQHTIYTIQLLEEENENIIGGIDASEEPWLIHAKFTGTGSSKRQNYIMAYAPHTEGLKRAYISFYANETPEDSPPPTPDIPNPPTPPTPQFPSFTFNGHKVDKYGYWDGDVHTPAGDSWLNSSFEITWSTQATGDAAQSTTSDSQVYAADNFGHNASVTITPWNASNVGFTGVEGVIEWDEPVVGGKPGQTEHKSETYEWQEVTYQASATFTITEYSPAFAHHLDAPESYTHTATFYAHTEYDDEMKAWYPFEYSIEIDGQSYSSPTSISCSTDHVFTNDVWRGDLQIIKTKNDLNPFTDGGRGTLGGGKDTGSYSTDSVWTIRLKSGGSEGHPYVMLNEGPQNDSFAHVYTVSRDNTGKFGDPTNPLTVSEFGQIKVMGLPYGVYIVEERKADDVGYVLETFEVDISEDQQVTSRDVNNVAKENIIKVVKVDKDTGKKIPAAGVTFRIRYMGNPSDPDPTQSEDYGRLLPNGSNILDGSQYLFRTDESGQIRLPYPLEYGLYQLEELIAPEGYYIGSYGEDGKQQTVDGSLGYTDTVAVYDSNGNKIDYTMNEDIAYNYYPFKVTEQDGHVDGEEYTPYYVTVEMTDNSVRGKIEILKLGEEFVGFKEKTDANGATVYEPVYESKPLQGVTFGIYAAEDILLEDGLEPPKAYDALTDEEIELVTDLITHAQFPDAEIVSSATLDNGAEIVNTIQREVSEDNLNTLEYLTPVRKGTTYSLTHTQHYGEDGEGYTVDYDITFGFEFSAGGWNYTDVHVKRTITLDDYNPYIDDTLPEIFHGEDAVELATTVFDNGDKIELTTEIVNEYDPDAVHVTPIAPDYKRYTNVVPVLGTAASEDDVANMPEYPDDSTGAEPVEYTFKSASNGRIVITGPDGDLVATADDNGDFAEWVLESELQDEPIFVPLFAESVVTNLSGIKGLEEAAEGFTFWYADDEHVHYQDEDGVDYVLKLSNGSAIIVAADGSDEIPFEPEVPDGWVKQDSAWQYAISRGEEGTPDYEYMVWMHDEDTGEDRWVHAGFEGETNKVRIQEINLTLTQHNTSTTDWEVVVDGLAMTNMTVNEEFAEATIVNPWSTEPVISDSVGCDIETVDGTTTIRVVHPIAPVYFGMMYGINVRAVYLGGYTKTTLMIPTDAEYPVISYNGKTVDWRNEANGGINPNAPMNEIDFAGGNYVRSTYYEATQEVPFDYYLVDIVSNAQTDADAFTVEYYEGYTSTTVIVPDAVTGVMRGNLQFKSIYRTMRYPMSSAIQTIETNTSGIATSDELPLGKYIIRELSAPAGYVVTNTAYEFELEYKDQYTPLVWATGTAENSAVNVNIDIYKVFEESVGSGTYIPKAGAVFGIYSYAPIAATSVATDPESITTNSVATGTLIATIVTDENGKAIDSVKLPSGDYYAQEISTIDGYKVNDTIFPFRVDTADEGDSLNFSYELDGISGAIRHSGYKTADVEIDTLMRYPLDDVVKVNGITYHVFDEYAEGTVGNRVLVKSQIDDDRSILTITAAAGEEPTVITLSNGSQIILNVSDQTYTAQFIDADTALSDVAVTSDIVPTTNSDGSKTYAYNPTVTATGYVAESSTIYVAPQTSLTSTNGTTLQFLYDIDGVRKAVINYPTAWKYYTDEDLPIHNVEYELGDVDFDGDVDADDLKIVNDYIEDTMANSMAANQMTLADVNRDGKVNEADSTLIEERIVPEAKSLGKASVPEKYIPDNAILFDTDGEFGGNNVYGGGTVDVATRTITIDLSKVTDDQHVYIGDALVTLKQTEISLTGEETTAANTITGEKVTDGYQPDALTLVNGNTLVSANRTLELSSVNGLSAVKLNIAFDHSRIDVSVTKGSPVSVWANGEVRSADYFNTGAQILPGNDATIVFADKSVIHVAINNTGYITMSVEGIVSGALPYQSENNPTLLVNGSVDGFMDAVRKTIVQTMPMDETSMDEVRLANTSSVTLARADSFIRELQVKINSSAVAENGDRHSGGIENDLRTRWIEKRDATTGKELAGAHIVIYDANGNIYAEGDSNEEGKFYFEKPEPGTYTFKETYAPNGYLVNEEVFTFVVHPDGTVTGDDTIDDEPIPTTTPTPEYHPPKIELHKTDEVTGKGLAGAEFEILNEDMSKVIYKGKTDANGDLSFTRPSAGTYWFHETKAPEGYKLDNTMYKFVITAGGKFEGDDTIADKREDVIISKLDATTGEGVPGAKIEVYDEDGNIIAEGYSDENGKFEFERPDAGTYWFHETVAPDGYFLNEELFTFTVNKDGTVTGDDTILDKPKTTVVISKLDATTAEGVPGALIEVNDASGKIVAQGYSDENGHFAFTQPAPGEYWFHEVVAPKGYVLNEEFFKFTVLEDGTVIGDTTITDHRDKVIISKLDVTTSEGVPGAKIEVFDDDGNIIAEGITDENGHFGFERPNPGTYWFHEVVAPDGYLLNEEMFSFEVLSDFTIVGDCTIDDIPNTIVIQKVESVTYVPLTGATVEFWTEDGELISAGVSDEDGNIYFAAPAVGTYIYKEKIAPEGYVLDEGTHIITLHADGTITGDLKLVNEPYVPRTGITSELPWLIGALGLAIIALVGVSVYDHKRKQKSK